MFSNAEIMLKMYLLLMVYNACAERSFSHLKRIKNELRSTMSQEHLNCLSLLNIESNILRIMNFDSIIEEFARRKRGA